MIHAERQGAATMGSTAYANAEAVFYQQYHAVRRDEIAGILLALFLGSFGIHHFYLRRTGLGILYCIFFWTGIPGLLGFFECFFMPGRVREFNAIQAVGIATALGIAVPGWGAGQPVNVTVNMPPAAAAGMTAGVAQPGTLLACPRCQQTNPSGAKFCSACGSAL
jgi:TM2 domain-containing membrane protein YozV